MIVPARNAGDNLRELLASLASQSAPCERFEVIIADDGSIDGSTERLPTRDGWARVMAGPPLNSYAARNRAARAARAPALAFCDADCRPEPAWLEAGLAELAHADLVAGTVRRIIPPRATVWTLLDLDLSLDQERFVRDGLAATANLFVRRDLFDRLGGFDDSLPSGGDFEFVKRCVATGARLSLAPDAVVLHPTHDTPRTLLAKVWFRSVWAGVRMRRDGRRPHARRWIPLSKFQWGLTLRDSIALYRHVLEANGVRRRLRDDLRVLPLKHLFVPYVMRMAELHGWRRGRRR